MGDPLLRSKILQVLRRQSWQELLVDRVLAECRLILFEAKAPQPTSEVHEDALTCPAHMMVQAKQRVHCRGSSSNGTILLGKGPYAASWVPKRSNCVYLPTCSLSPGND